MRPLETTKARMRSISLLRCNLLASFCHCGDVGGDSEMNRVISTFYSLMMDASGLDYTRAAHALRMTMEKVKIPMDQHILYIHLGA